MAFNIGRESGLFFVYVFFLVIVVVSFNVAMSSVAAGRLDVVDLHEDVFVNKLFFEDCFLYENDRVNFGILDLEKINQENFERCFAQPDFGLRFNLYEEEIELEFNEKLIGKELFCFDEKNFRCKNYSYYVNVFKDGRVESMVASLRMVGVT